MTPTQPYWTAPNVLCIPEVVRRGPPKVSVYHILKIASEMGGTGFEVSRLTLRRGETDRPQPYHVLLDGEFGDSCDCLGFLQYGRCRHTKALREAGLTQTEGNKR